LLEFSVFDKIKIKVSKNFELLNNKNMLYYLKNKKFIFLGFISLISVLALFSFSKIRALSDCDWSGWVNGWQDEFTYECDVNEVITGVHSKHSNHHEDRKFDFYCCDVDIAPTDTTSPEITYTPPSCDSNGKVTITVIAKDNESKVGHISVFITTHENWESYDMVGSEWIGDYQGTRTFTYQGEPGKTYYLQINADNTAGLTSVYGNNPNTSGEGIIWRYKEIKIVCQRSRPPVPQACSDGTSYGQCSSEKPKYCDNGNLVDRCDICGCPSGYSCQEDGSCVSLPILTQCLGDINNDKKIDIYDLSILMAHWGQEDTADLNNDDTVNLEDLRILLKHWGEICEDQCQIQGDVDNNGEISCDDLDCVLGVILKEKSLEECPCSDVNKDGEINQLDVSKEIDILLSKGIECGKCKQCSDCGKGLFNVCDREECLSCQENCYFIDKTIGGDCLSCSSINSCQNYQNDKTTCQTDPCGFGNCKWENDKCISIQPQTCSDGTPYGECSTTKPKYCDNGNLVDRCDICGCPSGYSCQENGKCVNQLFQPPEECHREDEEIEVSSGKKMLFTRFLYKQEDCQGDPYMIFYGNYDNPYGSPFKIYTYLTDGINVLCGINCQDPSIQEFKSYREHEKCINEHIEIGNTCKGEICARRKAAYERFYYKNRDCNGTPFIFWTGITDPFGIRYRALTDGYIWINKLKTCSYQNTISILSYRENGECINYPTEKYLWYMCSGEICSYGQ